jgi:membrane protein implicated in regulation of membrane protease activity
MYMEFLAIYREYVTLDVMWIGIAVLALIVKCFTKEYVTLCVAIGAIAAFVTSITIFHGHLLYQVITAVAVAFILAVFIQPYAMHKNQEQRMREAREKLIPHKDEEGIVIEKIDNMKATGRIRIGDEEFTARTANGMPVAVGEKVHVVDHDRHILLVM